MKFPPEIADKAASWFADKEFTSDWFTHNIRNWLPVLRPLRARPVDVLEIGSYEGRSAIFFLEFLPQSRVTCVDPFLTSDEFQRAYQATNPNATAFDFSRGYEARFDANLASFGKRVRKIKNRSAPALDLLQQEDALFDVIYIDGDHTRRAAFSDAVLAWPLLKTGGILIWDDYLWQRDTFPAEKRPEQGIDLFLTAFAPCVKELHRGYQMIVEKRSDWPQEHYKRPQRRKRIRSAIARFLRVLPPN